MIPHTLDGYNLDRRILPQVVAQFGDIDIEVAGVEKIVVI